MVIQIFTKLTFSIVVVHKRISLLAAADDCDNSSRKSFPSSEDMKYINARFSDCPLCLTKHYSLYFLVVLVDMRRTCTSSCMYEFPLVFPIKKRGVVPSLFSGDKDAYRDTLSGGNREATQFFHVEIELSSPVDSRLKPFFTDEAG